MDQLKGFTFTPQQLRMYGIIGSVVGIYLTVGLNVLTGTKLFSFIGSIAALFAVLWGANAIRRICSYGLGTGVPAMGMLCTGMGCVAAVFGLNVAGRFGVEWAGVIITLIYAGVFGYVVGVLCNKVMKFNIPIMEEGLTDGAAACTMAVLAWSVTISGSLSYNAIIADVYNTGFLALIFILGGMALFHPFNANLGPDEKQDRTLIDGMMVGGLAMIGVGICSLVTLGLAPAMLTMVVGFAIWYYFYIWYFRLATRDAAAVVGTGLLPPSAL
jgi:tetrahydromethanopterin S-methyltransferase subunit C